MDELSDDKFVISDAEDSIAFVHPQPSSSPMNNNETTQLLEKDEDGLSQAGIDATGPQAFSMCAVQNSFTDPNFHTACIMASTAKGRSMWVCLAWMAVSLLMISLQESPLKKFIYLSLIHI